MPILGPLLEKDGHSVITDAHPGGSDIESLKSVEKYKNDVDLIIFYKTSIHRSIITLSKRLGKIFKSNECEIEEEMIKLENHTYSTLENLDNRVFLIGGLGKVKQPVNVEFVVSSLIEELTGEEVPSHYDDTDICRKILDVNPKYFYPNGFHPNQQAIEYMYNLIKDKI